MTRTIDARELPWIAATPRRPLCDVPWIGNTTVAEDGNVQFCCYSPAQVGNVNEQTFAEVWNGPVMRRIRTTLASGDFPPECRTPSCPLLRGDEHHFIRERMSERNRGRPGSAPLACRAAIELSQRPRVGEALAIDFEIAAPDASRVVDVVAACTGPDGATRFLPELATVPLPFLQGVAVGGAAAQRLRLWEQVVPPGSATGPHVFHVALFSADSSLLAAANCLVAAAIDFELA